MKGIRVAHPKIKFADGELELNPNTGLYFHKERDERGTTKYILGWYLRPMYVPSDKSITIAVYTEGNIKQREIEDILDRVINGHRLRSRTKVWEYPGIKRLFNIKIKTEFIDDINQLTLIKPDVALVVIKEELGDDKIKLRWMLFKNLIPNKFMLLRHRYLPQHFYSIGRGLVGRVKGYIPYTIHDDAIDPIKERMGEDFSVIFIDSTRIGFLGGTLQLGTAAIVSTPEGIVEHVKIVPHRSEWDKVSAVLNELDSEDVLDTNTVVCVDGRVSEKDLDYFKHRIGQNGILVEISRESIVPRIIHEFENTKWGYGIEMESGSMYIINLTWHPHYEGITRPVSLRFRHDPFKNDLPLHRSIVKYLAWSSVLSPEAPVRPPSVPFYLHQAHLMCKLIYRFYNYLRKEARDVIKIIGEIRYLLEKLAYEKGGLSLLIHAGK